MNYEEKWKIIDILGQKKKIFDEKWEILDIKIFIKIQFLQLNLIKILIYQSKFWQNLDFADL